jgi:outer membrane immunogenic protein
MKKIALTFAILCAFCAWAYAGPEHISSKEVMQEAAPAPTSCFEGWYFGIHGGGLLTNFDSETSAFEDTEPPRGGGFSESLFQSTGRHNDNSGEGGLHAGYNWVRGGWVFGFEVDASASNLERSDSVFDFLQLPGGNSNEHIYTTAIDSKTELDWYSTGRLRVGHTLGDRVMIYGTGGGAMGLAGVSQVTSVNENTRFGGAVSEQFSSSDRQIRGGWTGGGGIDFCLTQNIILNFTYLYVDLGTASTGTNFAFTSLPVAAGVRTFNSQTNVNSDLKFHVFQGGLSFHF